MSTQLSPRRRQFAGTLALTALILLGSASVTFAQGTGTVRGTVTDAETGDPLPGANILAVGLNVGTSTGLDGTYTLPLAAGRYEIQASFIGFQAVQANLTVTANQTTPQDFSLEVDYIGAGEIVVLGTRRQGHRPRCRDGRPPSRC